jgi:hypothetical protein
VKAPDQAGAIYRDGVFAAVRESGTGTEEPISRTARGSVY